MIKKPFVLLELLIAFALVTFTILPFLHYPYHDVKQQLNCLFEIELQQHAQKELAKWEALLYSGDKDLLDRIFSEKSSKGQLDSDNCEVALCLADKVKRKYHRKLFLHPTSRKKAQDGSLLALVKIEVQYFRPKELTQPPLFKAKRVICCKKGQTPEKFL